MEAIDVGGMRRVPWNKGKLTGQKPPLKLKEIWAIRIRLQLAAKTRELAMFNLAIDSKLRACDLTRLRVSGICLGSLVAPRATVMQQKTQRPVQFEITEQTRASAEAWIREAGLSSATVCSRAGSTARHIFRRVGTLDWSIAGSDRLDSTIRLTERIRCGELKRLSYTGAPRICGRFNCC